ncbi:MAG: hypothetical protein WEB94_01855 [Candidatus Paceibacterota bacterium]
MVFERKTKNIMTFVFDEVVEGAEGTEEATTDAPATEGAVEEATTEEAAE